MSTEQSETGASTLHTSIPPDLEKYAITRAEFFKQNPQVDALAVGAVVYHKKRLLLIQRSASDRAFPNFWEIPGGGSEDSDETILHGVERELMEETGFKAKRFVKLVAQLEWNDKRPGRTSKWAKVNVEVEVEGIETDGDLEIVLAPKEHQAFVWATEEVVEEKRKDGTSLGIFSPREWTPT
ncbi:uncharacterized protein BDZ99DRAFT_466532 [Mytilinidion resinicola]|uniref:Nudix hydrolase domain-containing protein n=1 Tax=Mytilinidion resinicola TaxID=574789 RepID=A0A6A6YAN6_9PEZI|nr:uncharacterized protein BDZ99DRAFT_466532 [Mytilinidion resinicola]KAF2805563.1 hypothetical protein BDZ99DRAFT_466532 [Mytilinidion resinicola]